MIDPKKIDWKALKNPAPSFTIFVPTQEKMRVLAKHLMDGYLNMSDEYRDYQKIWSILTSYFGNGVFNIFYEVGDFKGLLGFTTILPEFKADVMMKILDKSVWKPSVIKETRKLLGIIKQEFKLKRLATSTPDERVRRIATMAGFKTEGISKNAFQWDGKFYKIYSMSMTKGG